MIWTLTLAGLVLALAWRCTVLERDIDALRHALLRESLAKGDGWPPVRRPVMAPPPLEPHR